MEAYDLMFAENNPAGIKAFLAAMGLIQNELRLPLVELSTPLMEKVSAYVMQ
jgi:4-hydroxy-tetrahydrodipicolinate synthase